MAVTLKKPKTDARRAFIENGKRVHRLLWFFDQHSGDQKRPNKHAREMLLSALVFTVAALDAYLHDLILEIAFTYRPASDPLKKWLEKVIKDDPHLILQLALADDLPSHRQQLREALIKRLSRQTFQGPDQVQEALAYIECPIAWQEFEEVTNRSHVARELSRIVGQRNRLVHNYEAPRITREQVTTAMDLVEALVMVIDQRVKARYNITP